jgi:ribosomal protein S18 acetylase RimI-like enzyme
LDARFNFLNDLKIANVNLITVSGEDDEFIEKVYFSTRIDEFSMLGWQPEQLEAFLKMQFNFQQQSYKLQFPDAEYFVVRLENERVGRMIIDRHAQEINLLDIAVLPENRRKGIGSVLIKELIAEAENDHKKVVLQVLKTNSNAFNLYKNLGFTVVGEDEFYYSMER